MNEVGITEQNVIDLIIARCKLEGEKSARAIVISREQRQNTMTRTVKIALVVTTNNEALVDALIQESVDNDLLFTFVGSNVELQGDMEIDYLFFEVKIIAKK